MQILINRLIAIIFLICWISFVLALIKPTRFIRCKDLEKINKKNVLKYYGTPTLIITILFGYIWNTWQMDYTSSETYVSSSYNTGITYDQIARTPQNYGNKKVRFNGEVLQVIEKDGRTQLRIEVNNNYNDVVLAEYRDDGIRTRFLEGDKITLSGRFINICTYKSTTNVDISIPKVWADNIDLNNSKTK